MKTDEVNLSRPDTMSSFDVESQMSAEKPIFDYTNLIINYLPPEMNSSMLQDLFSNYGTIVSCKVVVDHPTGISKGYGFVKFGTEMEGRAAQKALHQHRIGKKTLKVSFSRKPQHGGKTKNNTNLYVSNLDPKLDSEDLERHFRTCGYVVQCKVLKNSTGVSKQQAFVRFSNREGARRAIKRFDGKQLAGAEMPMNVRIAGQLSSSVNADFCAWTKPRTQTRVNATSSACYVSGFDVHVKKKDLRRVFAPWGNGKVKSIRVIRRQCRPYAFVNFYDSKDAAEAANTLNNTEVGEFTLTVRLKI